MRTVNGFEVLQHTHTDSSFVDVVVCDRGRNYGNTHRYVVWYVNLYDREYAAERGTPDGGAFGGTYTNSLLVAACEFERRKHGSEKKVVELARGILKHRC